MSKNVYLLFAIAAVLFGTFHNYALIPNKGSSGGSGSRTYIPGGSGGGFSGGHK